MLLGHEAPLARGGHFDLSVQGSLLFSSRGMTQVPGVQTQCDPETQLGYGSLYAFQKSLSVSD